MGATCFQTIDSSHIGALVEFNYKGTQTKIYCKEDDTMYQICNKFVSKTNLNEKEIYYIYNGRESSQFDKSLTFNEMANSLDKSRKKMNILVEKSENEDNTNEKLIRAKNVICPKCYESIKLKIKDYKISLFDCKNNHRINDIPLEEFENTQMINLKNIKCDICKENNKADTYNNEFYKCYECNKNLCPLCKTTHNKNHNVFNYDKSQYICGKHNEPFTHYCNDCKQNICTLCVNEHAKHDKILLSDLLIDKIDIMKKFSDFRDAVNLFNNNVNDIIAYLNGMKESMVHYYKLKEFLMNNYQEKERNYEILFNIKEIAKNNNEIIAHINRINHMKSIKDKFIKLYDIYNNTFLSEIKMTLKFRSNEKINILTYNSILSNNPETKIYINNKKYKYKEEFISKLEGDYDVLYEIKNPIKMNNMFSDFRGFSIWNIDLSNFDTKNFTDMSNMFRGCSITNLDLSNFDTRNVTNMSYMFYQCSIINLDLSNFDTRNVINMSYMFSECSITNLDLSNFDTRNVRDMSYMLSGCNNLTKVVLPKFNNQNTSNMNNMFLNCPNLLRITSSSVKNHNITNMSYMFSGCTKLKTVDLSEFDFINVTNMGYMFDRCYNLEYIDLSSFKNNNTTIIDNIFSGLINLKKIKLNNSCGSIRNMINEKIIEFC